MTQTKDLINWLNDAYSMELSLEETLQRHLKDFEPNSALHDRIEQHIFETRQHANEVRACIESLGGKVSRTKAIFGDIMGRMQGVSTAMFDDEKVKNVLMEYSAEHFEMACYESLAAGAEDLGEHGIAAKCRHILAQEKAMADWLFSEISGVTRQFLHSKHAAHA